MNIETVPIDSVHLDPANVRRHPDRNLAAIKASLARFGQQKPIVIDEAGVVRAGNGTLEAARDLGWREIAVVRTHLHGSEATAYAIADNRTGELAGWDEQALAEQLRALQSEDFDLAAVGYDAAEVDELVERLGTEMLGGPAAEDPGPQIDRAEELLAKWNVKSGDLWVIPSKATPSKEHRLLCGDSTKAKDVARVMGGKKAELCLTDPPYGIGLDYATHNDSVESLVVLAKRWLPLAREHATAVVFTPGVTRQWLYPEPDWVLCWFYGGGQLRSQWGFNCWQPILAYGKDPSLACGKGCRPDAVDMNTPANAQDIDHPCPKPIPLWVWLIERCSFGEADAIYDPFLGSGTTIVAAEQTGRVCRGIEIAPKYCAVILERLVGMGLEPILMAG